MPRVAPRDQKVLEEQDDDVWDLVIERSSSFLRFDFQELIRYKDLIWLFVRRDFVAQYKQTVLGPLWHVIQPLFTTVIYLFLFGKVAGIGTDKIEPPILFYLSGITIWNYFSAALLATSSTFVTNAPIFGKVYFPRLVLPISIVISNVIRFAIQFALLILFVIFFYFKGYPGYISINWLFVPVLVLIMAGISLGLGVIVSSLTTKYRDLSLLLTFAIQLGMYVTPIAYPMSYIKGKKFAAVLEWNPLTPVVEAFRYCLFGRGTFTAASLTYSVGVMIVLLFFGVLIFNKVEKDFMDTV
jgi:lipopolysaccharide transport system permease protein